MKTRKDRYPISDRKVIREYSDEKWAKVTVSEYPDGSRVTSHIPHRTPEEEARRTESIQRALAGLRDRMIELYGYERARELLEAKGLAD